MATAENSALRFLSSDPSRLPASKVKQAGWKGVMKEVSRAGAIVVTNHDEPQAVVVGYTEYEAMRARILQADSRDEVALDTLRRSFDERLAVLQREGAADRFRELARKPAKLAGKVKAGTGS